MSSLLFPHMSKPHVSPLWLSLSHAFASVRNSVPKQILLQLWKLFWLLLLLFICQVFFIKDPCYTAYGSLSAIITGYITGYFPSLQAELACHNKNLTVTIRYHSHSTGKFYPKSASPCLHQPCALRSWNTGTHANWMHPGSPGRTPTQSTNSTVPSAPKTLLFIHPRWAFLPLPRASKYLC